MIDNTLDTIVNGWLPTVNNSTNPEYPGKTSIFPHLHKYAVIYRNMTNGYSDVICDNTVLTFDTIKSVANIKRQQIYTHQMKMYVLRIKDAGYHTFDEFYRVQFLDEKMGLFRKDDNYITHVRRSETAHTWSNWKYVGE